LTSEEIFARIEETKTMPKKALSKKTPLVNIYSVVVRIKKLKFMKLWLGLARNIKEAEDKIEKEIFFELIDKAGLYSIKDIEKLMVCELSLEEVISDIPEEELFLYRKGPPLWFEEGFKNLTPPYTTEIRDVSRWKKRVVSKKKSDKNALMKKIINNKDKTLLNKNKKKFNNVETKYLLDKIK